MGKAIKSKKPDINRIKSGLKAYVRHNLLKDVIFDIIGSVCYGAGICIFAGGADFTVGGVSGLAMILNHLINFPIGVATLCLNIPIILFCYRVMGISFLLRSLKSMVISALFIDILFPMLPVYEGNPLLAAIFCGILSGAGLSMFYRRNSSTGGSDFLILSLRKLAQHVSIGEITMIADGLIIVIGALVYADIDAFLHGIIAVAVTTIVIDYMMIGSTSGKMLTIITTKGMEIAQAIGNKVKRGSTLINAIGTYTGAPRQTLLCACSKREMVMIRKIVAQIDSHAIITISTYDEAFGEGFRSIEEN